VGRGKTYLVDTFFECLPLERKKRIHFHRFMQKVHHELRDLKDQRDPLQIVAKHFADKARVLCFDEFFVSDITDAMLLSGLLRGLFQRGVTMIATSNIPPDRLYWGGLQRARFLPVIELIKTHLKVAQLDGGVDYRLRHLEHAELYHTPLDARADEVLRDAFLHLAPEPGRVGVQLDIEGRQIDTRCYADGVVWFDFKVLCGGPRSTADYIEIARCFHTVMLSRVPVMGSHRDDEARRFLNLIDEFYDRSVKLIMTGEAPIDSLYTGKRLAFEFQRATSRLKEMQSHDYLARPHLP
jgi:cell division protein ZapE